MSSHIFSDDLKQLLWEDIHGIVAAWQKHHGSADNARTAALRTCLLFPLSEEHKTFVFQVTEAAVAEIYSGWISLSIQMRMQELLAGLGYARYAR